MKLWQARALFLLCINLPVGSSADGKSTPGIPVDPDSAASGRGGFGARLDLRAFGADEDLTYVGFSLAAGLSRNSVGIVRGMFAERKSLALPGGGAIRHGGNGDIMVMNADGSNQVQISASDDSSPDWSPDGTKLVFGSTRDGNSEIYVMNAGGSNPVRLTNNAVDDTVPKWR